MAVWVGKAFIIQSPRSICLRKNPFVQRWNIPFRLVQYTHEQNRNKRRLCFSFNLYRCRTYRLVSTNFSLSIKPTFTNTRSVSYVSFHWTIFLVLSRGIWKAYLISCHANVSLKWLLGSHSVCWYFSRRMGSWDDIVVRGKMENEGNWKIWLSQGGTPVS